MFLGKDRTLKKKIKLIVFGGTISKSQMVLKDGENEKIQSNGVWEGLSGCRTLPLGT